jgi:hypothetical protein
MAVLRNHPLDIWTVSCIYNYHRAITIFSRLRAGDLNMARLLPCLPSDVKGMDVEGPGSNNREFIGKQGDRERPKYPRQRRRLRLPLVIFPSEPVLLELQTSDYSLQKSICFK